MKMEDLSESLTSHLPVEDPWVCPNDRQLALRAKLGSGWSVKSRRAKSLPRTQPMSDTEHQSVIQVIKRAELVETNEHQRVGSWLNRPSKTEDAHCECRRLVDRVRNIQKNAHSSGGDGIQQCALCAEHCGMWSSSGHVLCKDCRKSVCQKCSVDCSFHPREAEWLCKLCMERREVWKKSGAWFYKVNPFET